MYILVTGAAGFIGFHAAKRLLSDGHKVVGVDNLNSYYDVVLKQARLKELTACSDFSFFKVDLSDPAALSNALQGRHISHILHLAAQAGVRYSLENPTSYIQSNVMGHLSVLEYARQMKSVKHVIYASSSSVYGERSADFGFKETDRVRTPASLYAATKLSGEMLSESYSNLYGIRQTGLRFFTVYGSWGRPDMAYWMFSEDIQNNKPITLFAPDKMYRDFTYIDDIIDVIPKLLETVPVSHKIYNLGSANPCPLMELVQAVEMACQKRAVINTLPQQAGDVSSTFANIEAAQSNLNFNPITPLRDGIEEFVKWHKAWLKV